MLSFLKPKPAESQEAIDLERQLAEGEAAWTDLDNKFQRMRRVARPGLAGDRPPDATEEEIELSEVYYPRLYREWYDARQSREQLMAKLAMVRAGSAQAQRRYWLGRIADALDAVCDEVDGPFRDKLAELIRVRADAAHHEVGPELELPWSWSFESGEGLAWQLTQIRAKATNLRQDAATIETAPLMR